MRSYRKALPVLWILTAHLTIPLAAVSELCPVAADAPALWTVESEAGIALERTTRGAVVLERSPTHLVIAVSRPGTLVFEASACDLQATSIRTEAREHRIFASGAGATAIVTAFHRLDLIRKEEDHEIDPDPDSPSPGRRSDPVLTLIELGRAVAMKEEDHEIDPDPDLQGSPPGSHTEARCGMPTKEEDHEIDPDPDLPMVGGACDWATDWAVASALVGQLGPGWYFVVQGGEVRQEIFLNP